MFVPPDLSLPAGSLAAIILGTLLLLLLVFMVVMVVRYRTVLLGHLKKHSLGPPPREGALAFYGPEAGSAGRGAGLVYLDRDRQQINEGAILDKMGTNEYMTIPFDKDTDTSSIPVTVM